MGQFRVFGYGSLVHRGTHDHAPTAPLRIRGWRRQWVHLAHRPVAVLTALPQIDSEIEGLVLPVAEADRPALMQREAAYDPVVGADGLVIFSIPPDKHPPATAPRPILQSYLDVVVAGYLAEFGIGGVARFFETTAGWEAPLLADRAAPRYPRHQRLGAEALALCDAHVARLGMRVLRPED
ncbi:gamma-glutamylcyclotransferase family protein [Frigidibacter sp. ROC022]|uniref:gamma-glutamylcyclotransferase family protein n=1 Tax=Frigidibacter sp. ROC022 TaxID=2971796 RepID=UPI00215A478D|nr:gamma-glutamylcyclotransferase family protein [Frigidibacter sp. ROC022]MCR8726748.1 gamma-glutamylcyclotransferase [Frigidibacter sp. ROC022]